ncbi:MAG: hypothetical protein VYB58_01795 [Verrucomicrobiota bacterium]|nr:hypothetical protein [Verrucomicrobiota bacterium]MED6326808.1 hypothetical protein [Verrucomicrobiota bacterium]
MDNIGTGAAFNTSSPEPSSQSKLGPLGQALGQVSGGCGLRLAE